MSARDPELTRILILELERHLVALDELVERHEADDATLEAARRTVHALKGSAGLAGEPELASAMQRLERRLREGDHTALGETAEAVRLAIQRVGAGERAAGGAWPVPPPDLAAGPLDPLVRTQYLAEVTDRLARIDDALTAIDASPDDSAADVYRHIHTMKGAASAVGDEPMAWFCHGLEERLRVVTRGASNAATIALAEVAEWRAVFGALLDDPEAALAMLRGVPARPRTRPTARPIARQEDEARREGDGTIRVSAQSVDRLLDHASGIAVARERVAARVGGAIEHSRQLRRLRAELGEALRLIGPPRPWGAPAAALRRIERAAQSVAQIGDELDAAAERLKVSDQSLKDEAVAAKKILSTMRQTPIRGMFSRLAAAVYAEARRTGRVVAVRTHGADEPIDRRLIERLMEPCLQLARNAIAHGIEDPNAREALGKPREATLTLSASRSGNRLSVGIADDGAGVDVAAVRARAVETGVVTEVLAEAADDQTLLELLFLPGFSTRSQSPDLLAGRGIGLDITLASVQRLGGSIRLSSRHGLGFEARVDVPIESGLATVLWVSAQGVELAIPAANARRVRPSDDTDPDAERVPHLAACLEPRHVDRPRFVVDLDGLDRAEPSVARESFSVGVDAVGVTEEVLVRQLSPLLWGVGPYAGAIVRGDGSIRLALDIHALAPRARALGRVPEGRISEPPSRPPPSRRAP
ncbi:MAG: Hpt domain-containing protein [Labilithrix sp.]|nr:Hpt domain-containing protein [Labilithrix sp.]